MRNFPSGLGGASALPACTWVLRVQPLAACGRWGASAPLIGAVDTGACAAGAGGSGGGGGGGRGGGRGAGAGKQVAKEIPAAPRGFAASLARGDRFPVLGQPRLLIGCRPLLQGGGAIGLGEPALEPQRARQIGNGLRRLLLLAVCGPPVQQRPRPSWRRATPPPPRPGPPSGRQVPFPPPPPPLPRRHAP